MESLDHVLVVMEDLIGFVQLSLSQFLLVGLFFSIYFSSGNLIIFESLDSLVFFALSFGLNCVGPLSNTSLTYLLELFALIVPHSPVILLLICLRAHTLNSIKLVDR